MSKADLFREAWLKMRGFPYVLGAESNPDGLVDPAFDVGKEPTTNPKAGDCSGDYWAALVYAGAYLDGHPVTKKDRHTADTWFDHGEPFTGPMKVGDAGFLVNTSGRAYHMFAFIGNGQVGEMGFNHECRITTVGVEDARGAKWRRFDLDLGELTGTAPIPVIPPQLRYGSQGVYVFQLQAALNKLGYRPRLVVDGDFGWKTRRGVLWAQRKFGLWRCGICGPKTWAAILGAVAKL
jgi:hypothetical protein